MRICRPSLVLPPFAVLAHAGLQRALVADADGNVGDALHAAIPGRRDVGGDAAGALGTSSDQK
jgi:hypothetical protein